MADRIELFQVTVPAGTAIAAPLVTATNFADGEVTRIIVTIPPGPSGFSGFKFMHLGGPVIPYTGNGYVIGDDRVVDWSVTNMPTATGWQFVAYNTDIYDHTYYIEYLIDEIVSTVSARVPAVAI